MRNLLFECISKLVGIGIIVKIIVCDQGSVNRQLHEMLGVSPQHPYFYSPHILKSVRNKLKMYTISAGDSIYRWEHIQQFFQLDMHCPFE